MNYFYVIGLWSGLLFSAHCTGQTPVLRGHYMELQVINRNCEPVLEWIDFESITNRNYIIERSYDGEVYETIEIVAGNSQKKFTYTDKTLHQSSAYYRVKVNPGTGNSYESSTVHFTNICNSDKITIYPNPARDQLMISLGHKATAISLYSINGKNAGVWQLNGNERQVQLDISKFSAGQYIIRIQTREGVVNTYPFIKQ